MRYFRLIPKMAVSGIKKNGVVYAPYIFTTAFSIAVFFLFSCIVENPMLEHVPHAMYAVMLMQTGRVLLGVILIPFLFYTNSFLIRRRKKELGLYTVLGLEKKHVAAMMVLETALIYLLSMGIGLIVAAVFGKLVFAFLLRACHMASDISFTVDLTSFMGTALFFAVVSALNLVANLWQVTMANPVELLRSGKKGEKEPKHLPVYTVLGLILLFAGYRMTMMSRLDSMIFLKFPAVVLLIVLATYFLFTSGSILLLKWFRKKKNIYYKKDNFICISGMLYRMKKSAASLVNICIFSSMVMVTLVCTISLRLGEEDAILFFNPYDFQYSFTGNSSAVAADFEDTLVDLAEQNQIRVKDTISYLYGSVDEALDGNRLEKAVRGQDVWEIYTVRLLSLSDYNRIQGTDETLKDGEVLFYTNREDRGFKRLFIQGKEFSVKKELADLKTDPKEEKSMGDNRFYLIVKDQALIEEIVGAENLYYAFSGNLTGEESQQTVTLNAADAVFDQIPEHLNRRNVYTYGGEMRSMDGGLLFIGVFFGLLFSICLVLIMYYKQISEGFEDQDSFHIMKKVGMSDEDIRKTIRRQILLVFGIPLVTAVLHIICSMNMIVNLLYTLNLFHTTRIYLISAGVMGAFFLFYGISYLITARTYYKIVR